MGDRKQSVSFRKRCGLQHLSVIFRHWVDESTNKIRRRPAWGMMDDKQRDNALEQVSKAEVHDMWRVLRREVDMLPKVGQSHQKCRFWSPNLEWVRRDVKQLRKRKSTDNPEHQSKFNICRCIYQVLIVNARRDYFVNIIERASNPDVFRLYKLLETKRTLPAMIDE